MWISTAKGKEGRFLTPDGRQPRWTPDGEKIIFVAEVEGKDQLFAIAPDGSGRCQLTQTAGDCAWLAISPDGSTIAFQQNLMGNQEIYSIDLPTAIAQARKPEPIPPPTPTVQPPPSPKPVVAPPKPVVAPPEPVVASPKPVVAPPKPVVAPPKPAPTVPVGDLIHCPHCGALTSSAGKICVACGKELKVGKPKPSPAVTSVPPPAPASVLPLPPKPAPAAPPAAPSPPKPAPAAPVTALPPEPVPAAPALVAKISRIEVAEDTRTLKIWGTAAGTDFKEYRVETGLGEEPAGWEAAGTPSTSPVEDGCLATWMPGEFVGDCQVRLTVNGKDGSARMASSKIALRFSEYGAQLTVPKIRSQMIAGEVYRLPAKVRNTGSITWLAKGPFPVKVRYQWQTPEGGPAGPDLFVDLPKNIEPEEEAEMIIPVQAPTRPAEYLLCAEVWQVAKDWHRTFTRSPLQTVVKVKQRHEISILSQTTPREMVPGQIYRVNLRLENNGVEDWPSPKQDQMMVSYRWLDTAGNVLVLQGLETALPQAVASGSAVNMTVRVQAPFAVGSYRLQWGLRLGEDWLAVTGPVTASKVIVVGTQSPLYAVRFGDYQGPKSMAFRRDHLVIITATNIGSMTWQANGSHRVEVGYRWVVPGGKSILPGGRSPLPHSVAPGRSATIALSVIAPPGPGTHVLHCDLDQVGVGWFSERGSSSLEVPIEVTRIYGVRYLSHTIPIHMISGQTYQCQVYIHNLGTLTWSAAGSNAVVVGYKWLDAEKNLVGTGIAAALPQDVPAGGAVKVTVSITAPEEPGDYLLYVDLLQEPDTWFLRRECPPLKVAISVM